MANSDAISIDALARVARDVGESMATTPRFADRLKGAVEIGESFQLWMIGEIDPAKVESQISQLVTDTHRWHHQIRIDGQPAAFARTRPASKGSESTLMQVTESELVDRIDKAIHWIDVHTQCDWRARLLAIPSYSLHAFWLEDTDAKASYAVIIHRPQEYSGLLYSCLYDSKHFLTAVSQEDPVVGVRLPPDATPERN